MDSKGWTVVRFVAENAVEAVPNSWISNNECYWPQYNVERLKAAIKKYETPQPNWPKYKIDFFRNSTYTTYIAARCKTAKAENTSDLGSDCDAGVGRGLRKKILNRLSSSSESDEASSSTLPEPPAPNNLQSGATIIELAEGHSPNEKSSSEIQHPEIPVKTGSKNGDLCTCCPLHTDRNEGFFRQIIRKQSILQATLMQVLDELATLKVPEQHTDVVTKSIFVDNNLPMSTEEEVTQLESYLVQGNMEHCVTELSKIGGSTPYDFIKRTLPKFMSNKLTSEYSWIGAKKKKVFSQLQLATLISCSIRNNNATQHATDKDIEDAFKKFLRRAKERWEAEEKKKTVV